MPSLARSAALTVAVLLSLSACPRNTQAPPAESGSPAASAEPASPPMGKRAAGQENEPVLAWRALGTEPFWGVRVDGGTLVFTTPENPEGTTMAGRRVPSLVGFVFVGKHDGRDFHLGLTPGECSDGMSDNRYEYVATFTVGDTTYNGCGEAAK